MKRITVLLASGVCLWLTGCAKKEIALLSTDGQGQVQEQAFSKEEYQKHLEEIIESVGDSTLTAVNRQSSANPWALRTVVVGVGLKMDFNAGVLGLNVSPGMRFAFSNSAKPNIP